MTTITITTAASCIHHTDTTRIFPIFEDYLALYQGKYACASTLWTLESRTNERLVADQSDLWLALSPQDFPSRHALRQALSTLERHGLVEVRYVRQGEGAGDLIVYRGYRQAQRDKSHQGAIEKQYRLNIGAVNAALLAMRKKSGEGNGNNPRGGNLREIAPTPPSASQYTAASLAIATRGKRGEACSW
ncbi:MAG: hypothetical protein H0W02_18765 [Ktedonobacteraceae bacterium]|nr:hypothetical protein [Ktedonobacteraceae bacterium]